MALDERAYPPHIRGNTPGMDELIHIHNQGAELRADSREIAEVFGLAPSTSSRDA